MRIKNKRLTYKDLIAKDEAEECPPTPEVLDVALERIVEPFPF